MERDNKWVEYRGKKVFDTWITEVSRQIQEVRKIHWLLLQEGWSLEMETFCVNCAGCWWGQTWSAPLHFRKKDISSGCSPEKIHWSNFWDESCKHLKKLRQYSLEFRRIRKDAETLNPAGVWMDTLCDVTSIWETQTGGLTYQIRCSYFKLRRI